MEYRGRKKKREEKKRKEKEKSGLLVGKERCEERIKRRKGRKNRIKDGAREKK